MPSMLKVPNSELSANRHRCYLGGAGIAEALRNGADIVICGRVADAAPTVGASMWWHGWQRDDFDEIAGSLIAGHLIECAAYVCGGYFSGFKRLQAGWENFGFPIAEVHATGEVTINKEPGTGGEVSNEVFRLIPANFF